MEAWIFKLIWIPIAFIIGMCCMTVLAVIIKDVGWNVPFRWLVFIMTVAMYADWFLNK